MPKDLAIILNSGSINSAVTTALAAQKYRPILIHAQTVKSIHPRARLAYDQQVEHFKPYREHSIELPFLAGVDDNAASAADPRLAAAQAQQRLDLVPAVAIAARLAAHYQASAIYLGIRAGPASEELAATTEFAQIWTELFQISCGQTELEMVLPLVELEAWQVVDLAYQVGAPLEKTWSCLEQGDQPCGACRGCRNRQAAFAQANRADPLAPARKT
ncbi:MAG TPA: 7-cyano-7-deazaguanine synthase [Tepidisphaeraceae bacterium]|nr:7-cyano-7-deazaguanine synthase [Tepidisphaeraceae bacterium]